MIDYQEISILEIDNELHYLKGTVNRKLLCLEIFLLGKGILPIIFIYFLLKFL